MTDTTKNIPCKGAVQSEAVIRFSVSGSAAHARLVPLLPKEWEDCSPSFCRRGTSNNNKPVEDTKDNDQHPPHFVWENAPRKDSKVFRDKLKAYSHLPNGTSILDSKWVLARLLVPDEDRTLFPSLAALESHCFRGPDGYATFCQKFFSDDNDDTGPQIAAVATDSTVATQTALFPDLLQDNGACPATIPQAPSSLWVIKDAFSNGAGGIWVVDKASSHILNGNSNSNDGPLYKDHRYVAQRYTWPPVLYGGRKCHVRVYGLITADGSAFVHRRAFLHVANDEFIYDNQQQSSNNNSNKEAFKKKTLEDSVHITNCCANSHDDSKFAGEILADLEATEFAVEAETGQTIVPLGPFFESMKASLAALTERSMPYLSGGQGNNGFEYLGMDFILSYKDLSNSNTGDSKSRPTPVAYLLEVNAPPSQDTATGLKHAEDLHDDVIRDILTLWVFPKVTDGLYEENPGGWRHAYRLNPDENGETASEVPILPSKAAIINRIRWGMVERRALKSLNANSGVVAQGEKCDASRYVTSHQDFSPSKMNSAAVVSAFARTKFPFFQHISDSVASGAATEEPNSKHSVSDCEIFWENAGGSQVPFHVIEAMTESLSHRNRSTVGSRAKTGARTVFGKLLGAPSENFSVFLGANASSLLTNLANQYVQLGLVQKEDEIVLSTENHLANTQPWLLAAQTVGAKVRWWAPLSKDRCDGDTTPTQLKNLLTRRTRIVAVSHASNILGQVRDISSIRAVVDRLTGCRAHLVVDGVAAAPHIYPALSDNLADWYVVSCHKLFGPHVGAICGRNATAVKEMCDATKIPLGSHDAVYKLLEIGTINYEGCSGIEGLGEYFVDLATLPLSGECRNQSLAGSTAIASHQSAREEPSTFVAQHRKNAPGSLTLELAREAFRRIRLIEEGLLNLLLFSLRKSEKVRVIEIGEQHLSCTARLPVVSFVHKTLKASSIVDICSKQGVACRHGTFLSNPYLLKDFGVSSAEGVVRLSLAHYNTKDEIKTVESILHSIAGWF